jgi:hypothetical protein
LAVWHSNALPAATRHRRNLRSFPRVGVTDVQADLAARGVIRHGFDGPRIPHAGARRPSRADTRRAALPRALGSSAQEPAARELWDRVRAWMARLGLEPSWQPSEARAFRTPLGALAPALRTELTWCAVELSVIAWGLRRAALPGLDALVDPFELTDAVGLLDDDALSWLPSNGLRPAAERKALREWMYAVHVRLAQARRDPAPRTELAAWVPRRWLALLGLEASRCFAAGDLALGGVTLSAAPGELRATSETAARHRHLASIWLAGEVRDYDDATPDT